MDTLQARDAEQASEPGTPGPLQSSQSVMVQRNRLATAALALAVIAASATIVCSVIVGLGLGPLQTRAAIGAELAGDAAMISVYYGLLLSNILWAIVGATGLVLGITAARQWKNRSRAIAAIVVAVAAPIVSFAIWLLFTLLTSPLG